jgi:hypothetical protein
MSRLPAPAFVLAFACVVATASATAPVRAQVVTPVPEDQRGRADAERQGTHDAARIRTSFWNFGMVGDYPQDPQNVDLSVFHSVEVPKGSGMNYGDGITPFVLAKIQQRSGVEAYIMETGFRERQGISPYFNRIMRFEPRPGYFEPDPSLNRGRSPAISNDPRTWPSTWPDRQLDPDDPGWSGSWNGYFGKRAAADQESFTVMDDQFYDAWDYEPDSRDPTRKGLGLRIEVRGFQWANPQAGNVIFWHYDITNEGTTDYDDNIIFGLYMDSGVGGSALSCDGIFESDDDNAFFDKSSRLNLVYTWDRFGHGRDLSGNCGRTGYLGYAYLETPGNRFNGVDDDADGIRDERRDGGEDVLIVGADAIRADAAARYDLAAFEAAYGPIEDRPAYRAGQWWTGDEDMDWTAEFHDVGGDGVAETNDTGEGDGRPTAGEPNFDRTDLNESDQIGLTGFKMNRIRAGAGNPDPTTDNILFYTDAQNWPQRLYEKFTDPVVPARFDSALAANYNLGFLFASGPFVLKAGQTERFSLALAFGATLTDLRANVQTVQQIYDANYQFAVPPPLPTLTAEAGDGYVRLAWDDVAERGIDPVSNTNDFEGYRIYRSTEPDFLDPQVISTGSGSGTLSGNGRPIAQFDLIDDRSGYSQRTVDGVSYWLGDETGLTHAWTDTTVVNGQEYYYAVTAYDYGYEPGPDSLAFYPSENAITVSRTPRGGLILPKNAVRVRPNPKVAGFQRADATLAEHVRGEGEVTVAVEVVNSTEVPDGHVFKVLFENSSPDSIRAETYMLVDSTTADTLFDTGRDFAGAGTGPVAAGLLPIVAADSLVRFDAVNSGFAPGSPTDARLKVSYQPVLDPNLRREGYPYDFEIRFSDQVVDTSVCLTPDCFPDIARPARFEVFSLEPGGERKLDFVFRDRNNDGTLSRPDERIDIVAFLPESPDTARQTWRVELDTTGVGLPVVPPGAGDTYVGRITLPVTPEDVFVFSTSGERQDAGVAAAVPNSPYVVPNPYVGAASFEPQRFATSGRGERRIEFRAVPRNATIRIYTVRGDLVQTLHHDGSLDGFVPWDLRSKDNLSVAPGLYVFQVEAPGADPSIGKFAVIK